MNNEIKRNKVKKFKTIWFCNKNIGLDAGYETLKWKKWEEKICKACKFSEVKDCTIGTGRNVNFRKVYNCVCRLRCTVCNKASVGQISSRINIRLNSFKTDIRKLIINKKDLEVEINNFSKTGIGNIKIFILKIVTTKIKQLICGNEMVVKFGTVYPYGLNVMFKVKKCLRHPKSRDIWFSLRKFFHHKNIHND